MYDALSGLRDILRYALPIAPGGCVLSLDQAKAFDRVAHSYLFDVLVAHGFPASFRAVIKRLYEHHRSRLFIIRQSACWFSVCCGVMLGCPLSPALFPLVIDTFLWNLGNNSRIQGLRLPDGWAWKLLAYADDVTVLLGNADSPAVTLSVYDEYGALSGGLLNLHKTRLMPLGSYAPYAPLPFARADSLKVLGVTFTVHGPVLENWTDALELLRSRSQTAAAFDLSLRERSFLVRAVVCGRLWHISHVSSRPR